MMKHSFPKYLTFLFFSLVFSSIIAQEKTNPTTQSEELGKITWFRNYEEALELATKEDKQVLILFQEVPGCTTCRNYGKNALSHPLMVEAIENLFVPLAIFNNKGGEDRKVLQKYKEPTWNNPVVRIVNSVGWDVIPRVAGDYSATGLYNAMEKALNNKKVEIPEYMKLLKADLTASSTSEKYYKMYCFWSGEKHLGSANGVLKTEAGFMNGHEVVKVKYDNQKINERQLNLFAKAASISPVTDNGNYRFSDKDHLFYLKKSAYQYLPLTDLQKTKINSALGSGLTAAKYLSPKQKEWFKEITEGETKKQNLLKQDILTAWNWN